MSVEEIQYYCKQLPNVTEGLKWGEHLCFCIDGKMFLILGLDQAPVSASFKVNEEEFASFPEREGFKPAPYLARYKWIFTDDINRLSPGEWQRLISQAYQLVKSKLPNKIQSQLGK